MPTITRGVFSALNSPDLFNVFVETGLERPLEYPMWANVSTMPWNPITNRRVSGLTAVPDKPEGDRFPTVSPLLGTATTHTAYPRGMATEFTWEAWSDELYGYFRGIVAQMRMGSNNRLETDAHSPLNNAFSTSFAGFESGVALCSTSHVTLRGQTWANTPAVAQSFGTTYIQGAIRRFHAMPNEDGLPMLMHPTMALIHYDNIFVAREVLGSSGAPYTADHEINSLIQEDLRWMVSHYLTTATYAFLLCAQGVHDLQFGVRDAPMFDSFDDPWTKNAVNTVYQRNTLGYYDSPRGVDGTAG